MLPERLREKVERGELRPDPLQRAAAERLDRLARELDGYRPAAPKPAGGLLARLGLVEEEPVPEAPRGVYLHGDVGRGKSMLMDLFHDEVRFGPKRRVHFHEFMIEVQRALHAMRQEGGREDPLKRLAATLAERHLLLCFDEFHVSDIADAMILGRLFEGLFERGVVVVATSNWPPRRLYEGGLNRDRFLPFIDLLVSKVDVVALDGPVDYRLRRMRDVEAYLSPAGHEADARLDAAFAALADGEEGAPEEVAVGSRRLRVPRAAGGVAMFPFADLCAQPLGPADYLALTDRYHTLILKGVPLLTPDKRNEARRFVTLVDALYERRTMLLLSAAAPPEQLYPRGEGAFEFRRTVSRLEEMRSGDYLERCRERPQGGPEFVPFALTSDLT
jgi:cell division protein ZapE